MKLLKLTYSEILKQTKKLSFKVCLIILLAFAIGIPVLFKALSQNEYSNQVYSKEDLSYYEDLLIKNPKTDEEQLENKLNEVMIDTIKMSFVKEKDKEATDFKISLYEEYKSDKMTAVVLEYMIEGKTIDYARVDEEFNLNSEGYKEIEPTELLKIKDELLLNAEETIKIIDKNDYTYYLNEQLESLKNSEPNEENANLIKVYEKLIQLNITDDSDFRISEAKNIIENYNQKETPMTKQEYKDQKSKISYDDYLKLIDMKNETLDNSVKKSWYAIEHNINYNKEGTKSAFNDSIQNNTVFLSIIIVIIAGGIVANEFQKGTIRLLVIRPNKRWKILLSKFLAIISIIIVLALTTYIASFVINGLLFGFEDYFISDLAVKGGSVVEVSYILNSFVKLGILLIPIIFVGLIAFSLSTISKNTALSVGISIFLLVGYSLIIMMMVLIGISFIDLTFLPYLEYVQFTDPLSLVNSCYSYDIYYTFKQANIVLLIWAILIYVLTNYIFIKRDIKN